MPRGVDSNRRLSMLKSSGTLRPAGPETDREATDSSLKKSTMKIRYPSRNSARRTAVTLQSAEHLGSAGIQYPGASQPASISKSRARARKRLFQPLSGSPRENQRILASLGQLHAFSNTRSRSLLYQRLSRRPIYSLSAQHMESLPFASSEKARHPAISADRAARRRRTIASPSRLQGGFGHA